ncbi:MAG: transketolase [Gemmatimonadota bacterium]
MQPLQGPAREQHLVDAIRVLSMDAVQKANSGHPGAPMGLAPLGYEVWTKHLRHNPLDPTWPDRDRFVLSLGHASMLIYSLLYLTGYDLTLDDLKDFRQWGSRTPGHPEYGMTPGVETTTGPLGQGVANSVGMALAERWLANRFNKPGHDIVDHFTYVFCSDGDLMEGISHEAAEMAGHQRLGKLIWIYDDNQISIEGDTDLASSTDQELRFRSYGWHVTKVDDGNDRAAMNLAIQKARKNTGQPSLIILRTQIAFGSPGKAGSESSHGAPLGEEEVRATKENLGYRSLEPFFVEPAALDWCREECRIRGRKLQEDWEERFEAYREAFPDEAAEFEDMMAGGLPEGWDADVPDLISLDKPQATRASSGNVLQALAARIPNLIGGSADLGGSNKTDIKGGGSLLATNPGGRIIHFGVREHAMASLLNGMALHGGVRPFAGTFLVFSDYMRPAMRMAALMEIPVTYVFTHDSIGLGEDGPTHQPIEHLMALRAIPNLVDLRPGDPAETAVAWKVAMEQEDRPTFLSLTRQGIPCLDRTNPGGPEALRRGGYIMQEASGGAPKLILLASGSELHLAVEARGVFEGEGVPTRVVSLPSWQLFMDQDQSYRDHVLPPGVTARVSVEAGTTLGWGRWLGSAGAAVGIDHFGASAPWDKLFREFGITTERVVALARGVLES